MAKLYKRHRASLAFKSEVEVAPAHAHMPKLVDIKTLCKQTFSGKAAWKDAHILSAIKCLHNASTVWCRFV